MVRKSTGTGFLFFLVIVIAQFGLNKYLKYKQSFFETLNNVIFHYLNISVLSYFLQYTNLPLPTPVYDFSQIFVANKVAAIFFVLVATDLLFYFVHRLSHNHAFLWVFHEAHHNTNELNFSAATRNPFYNLLAFNLGRWPVAAPLMLLGLPVEYIYIVTNISLYYAVWNHSGYMLTNKYLAWIFITPQIHAIHHEKSMESQRTNYGNIFSFYDRFFNTYKDGECTQIYGSEIDYDASNFVSAQVNPLLITLKKASEIRTLKQFFNFFILGKPLN